MKLLVVGSGGREHAVIRKLKENKEIEKIYCAPGNGGISADAECVDIKATDKENMVKFAKENAIDFTKKNQSVTYLVFNESCVFLGYFTIAIKPITIKCDILSNTMYRKISRVAKLDETEGIYSLSAYLIAQLGKNYAVNAVDRVDGSQLMGLALNTVKNIQNEVGGMVVFLEAEPKPKLMEFYKEQNGFVEFETRKINSSESKEQELVQLLRIL